MKKFSTLRVLQKKELQNKYKEILEKIGDDQFFTKKELHYLPEILLTGEQVLVFSSGSVNNNTWLIVLTNKRIVFLNKGMLFGLKQISIPLNKINSISGSTGIIFGTIGITHGSETMIVKNV